MDSRQRQTQQEMYEYFANRGGLLLSTRHLAALTEESYHSVEDIFQARYDSDFIANIPTQPVFQKTICDLENIIAASKRIKIKTKNKPAVILQDETYLNHYLHLLFTDKEKEILQGLISANFQQEAPEEHSTEVLAYILKGIFGIDSPPEQEVQDSFDQFGCEFNDFD